MPCTCKRVSHAAIFDREKFISIGSAIQGRSRKGRIFTYHLGQFNGSFGSIVGRGCKMISPCLLSNTIARLSARESMVLSGFLHFSNGTVPGGNSSEYVPAVHCSAPSLSDMFRLVGCYRGQSLTSRAQVASALIYLLHRRQLLPFSASPGTLSRSTLIP